ncbi:imidazole glycerol phosphate synthase subunit HisH [Candidatus Woesearchaeota archaeon]|jgi:imidazole glycerol-phosphate synthase subunit HisH|nr:imidazole glycerol phosphate synthase subunit HisH [Candidatus Woesearchaeota archaeon]
MIGIIDYGMGNIGSIENMLKRINTNSIITSNIDTLNKCNKLILPGVGAFDQGMKSLNDMGLISYLNNFAIKQNKPILGICLGMQLFANSSEEGSLPGLGWIKGKAKKFVFSDYDIKVPHMGWNTIETKNSILFDNLPDEKRFYFVHSYYYECDDKKNIIAYTNYGIKFASAINKNHIWGTQFHPEKSHVCGMKLLDNFSRI